MSLHILTRRKFLQTTAAMTLMPLIGQANDFHQHWMISAFYSDKGKKRHNELRWTKMGSNQIQSLDIDFRGHGIALNPVNENRVIVFPRRPGNILTAVDLSTGDIIRQVTADDGYHFYGHGVYSANGKHLFITENHYSQGQGVITHRNAETFEIIQRFSSGGVGPHDIRLLSDGKTLVVANGGIKTHPDQPRKKLNIDSMESSLTYIDIETGSILEQQYLSDKKLSIRHLAVTKNDEVVAVQQYQGKIKHQASAIVVTHKRGERLIEMEMDKQILRRMNGYTASVAVDDKRKQAVVTAPQGNIVTVWDFEKKQLLTSYDLYKPYGVDFSKSMDCFLITTAGQGMYQLSPTQNRIQHLNIGMDGSWDNHFTIGVA